MCPMDGPPAIVPGVAARGECHVDDDSRETPNDKAQPALASTGEIAAVVENVQRTHRGHIRWGIGRHTAELALRALGRPRKKLRRPSSSKSRRRKRHKRLL